MYETPQKNCVSVAFFSHKNCYHYFLTNPCHFHKNLKFWGNLEGIVQKILGHVCWEIRIWKFEKILSVELEFEKTGKIFVPDYIFHHVVLEFRKELWTLRIIIISVYRCMRKTRYGRSWCRLKSCTFLLMEQNTIRGLFIIIIRFFFWSRLFEREYLLCHMPKKKFRKDGASFSCNDFRNSSQKPKTSLNELSRSFCIGY